MAGRSDRNFTARADVIERRMVWALAIMGTTFLIAKVAHVGATVYGKHSRPETLRAQKDSPVTGCRSK